MTREADAWFQEFQRSGNPLALARVFDELAPELLLLAGHLMREPAAAEDILQESLLQAIQSARRFDPARGTLQAWLVGILVHCARKELRRRRQPLDPQRLHPPAVRQPVAEAAAREFLHAVDAALTTLPARYREVLRLGLLHGLEQEEIASALDRPRETVKTQFRRGLVHLRRRLPAEFDLSLAVAFTAGPGLRQIRSRLLEHASALPWPGPAAAEPDPGAEGAGEGVAGNPVAAGARAARPWWLARRTAVWSLAAASGLMLLAAATWWSWPPGTDRRGPAHQTPQADRAARAPTAPDAGAAVREPRPATSGNGAPGDAAPIARVRVQWADRTPAAGVGVRARPQEDRSWLREREARTGAEGTAELELPFAGVWRIQGDRGGETLLTAVRGQACAAELLLPAGILVDGTVTDEADRPLSGATIWIAPPSYALDECAPGATTGAEGRFQVRDVPVGWVVSASSAQLFHRRGFAVVADAAGRNGLDLVLTGPTGTVEGSVQEPDGSAAAGAAVLLARRSHDARVNRMTVMPWRLRTDRNGRFRAAGVPLHQEIVVWARSERSATAVAHLQLAGPGTKSLDLRLQSGAQVTGIASTHDGRPAAGARVAVDQAACDKALAALHPVPEWAGAIVVADDAGRFAIPNAMPGEATLCASLDGAGFARCPITLADGATQRWDPVLAHDDTIAGRVVDEGGAPLPRHEVSLRDLTSDAPIERATTNAAGGFRFRGQGLVARGLVVFDPEAALPVPAVRAECQPGPGPLRLVVPGSRRASAALTVRPIDAAGVPVPGETVAVLLGYLDGGTLQYGLANARPGPRGLRIAPLVPGRYQLSLRVGATGALHVGTFVLAPGADLDAGDVQFARTGDVEVVVRHATTGGPAAGRFSLTDPRAPYVANGFLLTDGRSSCALQPGTYFLSLWSEDVPPAYREVTVQAGGRHRLEIDLPAHVRRTVRIPGVTTPLSTFELSLLDASGTRVLRYDFARSQKLSETMVRAFVPGTYTMVVIDGLGRERRERFTVSADARDADQVIEVRLP